VNDAERVHDMMSMSFAQCPKVENKVPYLVVNAELRLPEGEAAYNMSVINSGRYLPTAYLLYHTYLTLVRYLGFSCITAYGTCKLWRCMHASDRKLLS